MFYGKVVTKTVISNRFAGIFEYAQGMRVGCRASQSILYFTNVLAKRTNIFLREGSLRFFRKNRFFLFTKNESPICVEYVCKRIFR